MYISQKETVPDARVRKVIFRDWSGWFIEVVVVVVVGVVYKRVEVEADVLSG